MFHKKPESPNELTRNRNIKISPSSVKWFNWGLVGLATIATVWGISDALHQLATGQVSLAELFAGISFRLFPIIFATLAALVIAPQAPRVPSSSADHLSLWQGVAVLARARA